MLIFRRRSEDALKNGAVTEVSEASSSLNVALSLLKESKLISLEFLIEKEAVPILIESETLIPFWKSGILSAVNSVEPSKVTLFVKVVVPLKVFAPLKVFVPSSETK